MPIDRLSVQKKYLPPQHFPCGDSFCLASCDMCRFPREGEKLCNKCHMVHRVDEKCTEAVRDAD